MWNLDLTSNMMTSSLQKPALYVLHKHVNLVSVHFFFSSGPLVTVDVWRQIRNIPVRTVTLLWHTVCFCFFAFTFDPYIHWHYHTLNFMFLRSKVIQKCISKPMRFVKTTQIHRAISASMSHRHVWIYPLMSTCVTSRWGRSLRQVCLYHHRLLFLQHIQVNIRFFLCYHTTFQLQSVLVKVVQLKHEIKVCCFCRGCDAWEEDCG